MTDANIIQKGKQAIKSLDELKAIKDKTKNQIIPSEDTAKVRVVVKTATCGIAAGARPFLDTFFEEVKKAGLDDRVTVKQTGCIGIRQYEPIAEVVEGDGKKVTYVKMNAEKAKRVVEEHLIGGQPVIEYTIASCKL